MGPTKAPDNNFGSVGPLGGLWGYPIFLCSEKKAPIDLALWISQDGLHWGPMDPCGGPVGIYSQTGDWAPESPVGAMKVIFGGPIEAQI